MKLNIIVECLEENCNESYVVETGRRLSERCIDHNGWDKASQIFKHSVERKHSPPNLQEFRFLKRNYRKNKFWRKYTESLLIKEKRSTLNTHERSIPLKLFN